MFNVPSSTLYTVGYIGDGFLWVKWPNHQCQSTEGRCSRIRKRGVMDGDSGDEGNDELM